MKINKRILIVSLGVFTIIFASSAVYFFFFYTATDTQDRKINQEECLGENEIAEYVIVEKNGNLANIEVYVYSDPAAKLVKGNFIIDNIRANYHPVEIHDCGIYVIKLFNYDPEQIRKNPGYRAPGYKAELWRYSHNAEGVPLVLYDEQTTEFKFYYTDFRINSTETYVVLKKSYLGADDYALVIKNLSTLQDAFILPLADITEQNQKLFGSLGLFEGWTEDSKYFWADIFAGANVLGFVRIDTNDWSFEVFEAPQNVLGGDALNLEKGLITQHPDSVWFGFADLRDKEVAKRRAEGIGTELYIYNLFTGERQKVTETDEPLWFFKPKWISDTELEYELPSGEKKVYEIKF